MNRLLRFLLALTLTSTVIAQNRGMPQVAQIVPPGPPYDPEKHVNPVITYVQSRDFKPSSYKEAQQATDIQLLGLSKEMGSLERIDLAPAGPDTAKELKLDVRGTLYPVVRQTFKTMDGGEVILCSFKAPKVQSMQSGRIGLPFPIGGRDSKDPKNKRFGPETPPEELEIRGRLGLIFEKENSITIAWQEEGVVHTVTSSLSRKDLFRVIDDLL
jgi:Domain of unknown function (DUF4367)